jgi:hypothetical protein
MASVRLGEVPLSSSMSRETRGVLAAPRLSANARRT